MSKFWAYCPSCNSPSSKESLAVFKLASDIALDPKSAQDQELYGTGVYLACVAITLRISPTAAHLKSLILSGTVRTIERAHDEHMATTIKKKIQKAFPPPKKARDLARGGWANNIAVDVNHSLSETQRRIASALHGNMRRLVSTYYWGTINA